MTEKSSSTVPIIVAVIGVVGTIATALIANWDKVTGGRSADPPRAEQPAQRNAAAAAQPETDRISAMEAAKVPVAVNVAGNWVDADGYEYVFEQTGTHYSYRQLKGGNQIGSGDGVLTGHSFTHRFTGVFGEGRCAGEVSADGNVSSGTCTNGPNTWDMRVVRSAAAKS